MVCSALSQNLNSTNVARGSRLLALTRVTWSPLCMIRMDWRTTWHPTRLLIASSRTEGSIFDVIFTPVRKLLFSGDEPDKMYSDSDSSKGKSQFRGRATSNKIVSECNSIVACYNAKDLQASTCKMVSLLLATRLYQLELVSHQPLTKLWQECCVGYTNMSARLVFSNHMWQIQSTATISQGETAGFCLIYVGRAREPLPTRWIANRMKDCLEKGEKIIEVTWTWRISCIDTGERNIAAENHYRRNCLATMAEVQCCKIGSTIYYNGASNLEESETGGKVSMARGEMYGTSMGK